MMSQRGAAPGGWRRFIEGRFVRTALPMVALVVAGSVGLSYLVESKMQVKVGPCGASRGWLRREHAPCSPVLRCCGAHR